MIDLQAIGKPLNSVELANILGVDRRTIIKYADRWGGVEVAPGVFRFFEHIVAEKINAKLSASQGQEQPEVLARSNKIQRRQKKLLVSRRQQDELRQGGVVGKTDARSYRRATDKHNIFGSV